MNSFKPRFRITADEEGEKIFYLEGEWPDTLHITNDLLEEGRAGFLWKDGRDITIKAANAEATYRIDVPQPEDRPYGCTVAQKVRASRNLETVTKPGTRV